MASFSHLRTTLVGRSRTFRSLRHRNFRLFYFGQQVSITGTWMQHVAQSWLVYRLTESSFMLGLVSATALVPILLFGLHSGVLADRVSRYRLFIATQVLAMAQALVLCILTLAGWVEPGHILVLAFFLGMVHALEMPVRHSFFAQLVPLDDLPNAVALNSGLIHVARLVGPAIAGWLVAWVGEGMVFLINAATFLAVIVALLAMRLLPRAPVREAERRAMDVREGLRFAWKHLHIRGVLSMVGMVSLVGISAAVLMPVFVAQVFQGGAQSLGWLLGAMGGGSLLGALVLARRRETAGLERLVAAGGCAAGVALTLFAFTEKFWLALVILPLVGFCLTMVIAPSNAYLQLSAPNHLRGRIMSLFAVTFHGLMPLGILAVGSIAEYVGASVTVAGCGMLLLLAALAYAFVGPRITTF